MSDLESTLRVAVTTTYDATDPRAFGGRGFYMVEAVRRQMQVEDFGPLDDSRFSRLTAAKYKFYRRLLRRRYTPERDIRLVRDYGRQIKNRLNTSAAELIFSPMSPGSQPTAYLETDLPIVIWTDATFVSAMELYPEFRRHVLANETVRDGLANERRALERADLVIYSSQWAVDSAVAHYGLSPEKVRILPFGPNLDVVPSREEVIRGIDGRDAETVKFLFLGNAWERKGGDIAFEVTKRLNECGQPAELIVVGADTINLPKPYPDFVKPAGYLSKSDPVAREKLYQLFKDAHFLIMPTRADCTPFVFSEACAFGLPVITTDVGGIKSVISEGVNGRTFATDAAVEEYVDFVTETFQDPVGYRALCESTRDDYDERLSWDVSGRLLKSWMQALVNGAPLQTDLAVASTRTHSTAAGF